MKKILSVLLIVAMLFSFAACAGGSGMTMGTGGTAGTYYGYGGVLGQYIKNHAALTLQ